MKDNIIIENNASSEDLISIAGVKSALLDFFRLIFSSLDIVASAIKRKKVLFALCCAGGLLAGYLVYHVKASYYTEMIVRANAAPRRDFGEIVANLNALALTGSSAELAAALKVDNALAAGIRQFEAKGLDNEPLAADTVKGLPLKIEAEIRGNVSTARLQAALLEYLNHHPYILRINADQKKIYQERLRFLQHEQQQLDSLKTIYNRTLATLRMPANMYNNALNPAQLYQHALVLAQQEAVVRKGLNDEAEPLTLMNGFKKPLNQRSVSLVTLLLLGLLAGAALGCALSLLTWIKRKITLNRS